MDYPRKSNLNLNNCGINMLHDIKHKHSKKKKKKNGKCQKKRFLFANNPARDVFIWKVLVMEMKFGLNR